jgi:hypothetical protein
MKRTILLLILSVGLQTLKSQNHFYLVSMHVFDSSSILPVKNALIFVPSIKKEISTNKEGNALLALPTDQYVIIVENDSYSPVTLFLDIYKDTTINISLSSVYKSLNIEEISVYANYLDKNNYVNSGLERLTSRSISRVPAVAGEKDIVKAIATLPGVSSGSEGSSDMYVRGGGTDQNLFLLDGNVIYKHSNLFGYMTSINPLSIERANFYKAGIPSKFGGKLSSVLEIHTRQPNLDSISFTGHLSILSANGLIDIPLIKQKSGILVTARSTYADKIVQLVNKSDQRYFFGYHDLYIKFLHQFNKNNRLNINLYQDRDYISDIYGIQANTDFRDQDKVTWNNRFANATFTHVLNNIGELSFFTGITGFNTTICYESIKKDSSLYQKETFQSDIIELTNRLVYQGKTSCFDHFEAGLECKNYHFKPAQIRHMYFDTVLQGDMIIPSSLLEMNGFASFSFSYHSSHLFKTGVRYNSSLKDREYWYSLEPRLNYQWRLNLMNSFKISYSKSSQLLHLLTNPGLGMPVDIYVPYSKYLKPEISHLWSIGYTRTQNIGDQKIYFSIESYSKIMDNVIHYLPGYSSHNFTMLHKNEVYIEKIVCQGKGKSQGIEFIMEKPFGRFNGWVSYTLSKTTYHFDQLNRGEVFPAKQDRLHNLSIVSGYQISKKIRFSATWSYLSGERTTLPHYIYNPGAFNFIDGKPSYKDGSLTAMVANSGLNEHRMKPFHRLNVEFIQTITKKRWDGECSFGVYNVYNRKNSYYYQLEQHIGDIHSEEFSVKPLLKSYSVFPVFPYVSIQFSPK